VPPPDRRRYDERDDYDDQPRRRPGLSPVLIVLLVFGGLGVLGTLACCGFWLFSWSAPRPMGGPAAVQVNGPARAGGTTRVYTRQEFRELVVGKTEAEVIEAVGKPDSTTDGDGAVWTYRNRTKDPATGETDPRASVHFQGGKAAQVNY